VSVEQPFLDEHGRYHGLRGRIVRAFQRLGYGETTLAIYDKALTDADLLLRVPARPAERRGIARCSTAMSTVSATSGRGRSSSSHPRCALSPICPGTAGRLGGRCAQDLRRARQEGHTRCFTVIHGATGTAIDLCNHRYRPTSAPSGPGGRRRRQQAPCSRAGRAPAGPRRIPTTGRAGSTGSEMVFNGMIDKIGMIIDAAGVVVIVTGAAIAFVVTAVRLSRRESAVYLRFRQQLGQAILLGLELLVAGDIIRTVAASPSLTSVAILAAIVLIRTFLSFSLQVETTGRWPWHKRDISAS
jgi:uncharacterized membrane protein